MAVRAANFIRTHESVFILNQLDFLSDAAWIDFQRLHAPTSASARGVVVDVVSGCGLVLRATGWFRGQRQSGGSLYFGGGRSGPARAQKQIRRRSLVIAAGRRTGD